MRFGGMHLERDDCKKCAWELFITFIKPRALLSAVNFDDRKCWTLLL